MDHSSCHALIVQGFLALTLLLVARVVYWLANLLFILPFFDPLSALPGPQGSFMQSHFLNLLEFVVALSRARFRD